MRAIVLGNSTGRRGLGRLHHVLPGMEAEPPASLNFKLPLQVAMAYRILGTLSVE